MQPILDYLNSVLFNIEPDDFVPTLEKALVFLLIWGLVFYLVYLLLTKLLFSKSASMSRDNLLKVNLLRSLIVFQVLFCIYLLFLVREVGLEQFKFGSWPFYLAILPQLLVFFGVIAVYYFSQQSFVNKLKKQ